MAFCKTLSIESQKKEAEDFLLQKNFNLPCTMNFVNQTTVSDGSQPDLTMNQYLQHNSTRTKELHHKLKSNDVT